MNMHGSYRFQAERAAVFAALLDPSVLKATIPGCQDAWYSAEHGHMKVRLGTPVPGLEGPYDITVDILEREEPHRLVIQAGRQGHIGGTITTVTRITLVDESEGSALTYATTAELSGPVAAVNNPLFLGMAEHMLKTFFKRINASLATQTRA